MICRLRLSPLKLLLPIAFMAGLAAPASAQSADDVERADVARQLQEARLQVRRLEEKLRLLELRRSHPSTARATAVPKPTLAESCGQPFFLDRDGVKRLRAECATLESGNSCEASPFTIGDDGIKRVRVGCGF